MARISTDGGKTFMHSDEFEASDYSYAWLTRSWRFIADAMDPETRAAVEAETNDLGEMFDGLPVATRHAMFLERYLDLAAEDIIIG